MIDRLKNIIAKAKYLTLTITDQGDKVQITATVRPKDGADPAKPIQVRADWQIADALLVEALNKPPKAGKTEVKKTEKKEEADSGDLFAGMEETGNADASSGNTGKTEKTENSAETEAAGREAEPAGTGAAGQKADDENKTKNEEK